LQFGLLLILVMLASLAEMASLGALLPFLGVLASPDKVYAHPYAQPFVSFLGITDAQSLLLPLTLVFVFLVLSAGVIRLALLWFQMRLSHAIVLNPINSATCIMLFHIYPMTRSWLCDRQNCISPRRIVS
jgi:hypothetical protein